MGSALRPLALFGLLVLMLPALVGTAPGEAAAFSMSRPTLAVAPALETWASAAAAPDRASGPTYRAVIVGISNYQYINDLSYCDDDARDIYNALQANGWNTANIAMLIDGDARKSSIRQAIMNMRSAAGPNDVCLFTFSGHGDYNLDDDGDESDPYDEFLCPYDTSSGISTMIRDDELGDWLSGFATPNLCVIIDSCFSGGMASASGPPPPPPPGAIPGSYFPTDAALGPAIKCRPKPFVGYWNLDGMATDLMRRAYLPKDVDQSITGVEVMMACSEDQYSYEDPYLRNGVFSFFVVDCIQTWRADANHDGAMSGEEIYGCAAPQAEAYVRRNFGDLMYPVFYDNHPGALILIGVPTCPMPTCYISYLPEFPGEGEEICFESNAYAECGVAGVEWDFGDGQQASGASACHTYDTPGTYTVICTVADLEGNEGACWAQVRVRALGCTANVGLVACSCSMSCGRVGQTKCGQIAAKNWDQEPCLVVMSVTDNAGNVVFESDPTWIEGYGKIRMRFEHTFTDDEIGRDLWTYEVWSPGCEELAEWDNVRERIVTVLPRAQYCDGVRALCVQYLGSQADVTVNVVVSEDYTQTVEHVNPGRIICVSALTAGLTKLEPLTRFAVYDRYGYLAREDVLVTSCQQPIYVGQPFGCFQITYLDLVLLQ
jgi:hypothetical protein